MKEHRALCACMAKEHEFTERGVSASQKARVCIYKMCAVCIFGHLRGSFSFSFSHVSKSLTGLHESSEKVHLDSIAYFSDI